MFISFLSECISYYLGSSSAECVAEVLVRQANWTFYQLPQACHHYEIDEMYLFKIILLLQRWQLSAVPAGFERSSLAHRGLQGGEHLKYRKRPT